MISLHLEATRLFIQLSLNEHTPVTHISLIRVPCYVHALLVLLLIPATCGPHLLLYICRIGYRSWSSQRSSLYANAGHANR